MSNKKLSKLNENLSKLNKKDEINKIICFRNKRNYRKIQTMKKMGLSVDKILDFQLTNSGEIEEINYDLNSSNLTMIFQNGKKILYKNVPINLVNQFKEAKSTQIFFKENIQNQYDSIEI